MKSEARFGGAVVVDLTDEFSLTPLITEVVDVEATGDHISVTIKDNEGVPTVFLELTHPFEQPTDYLGEAGWEVTIEVQTPDEFEMTLRRNEEQRVLKLWIVDPTVRPRQVQRTWQ